MENKKEISEFCPTKVQGLIAEGALMVDVREKDEVAQLAYGVPNVLNISISELEQRMQEIPKNKIVVLACKSGSRSRMATAYLINNGFLNVVNMKHGIVRWVQKGFPTIGDASSILSETDSCCCSPEPTKTESCCAPSSTKTEGCCSTETSKTNCCN